MVPSKLQILTVAAAVSTLALGQQTPPSDSLYSVSHVTVKADHRATYEDYLKKMSDGYKKVGISSYTVYRGMAGNPLEYMIVRPVKSFASLDEGNQLANVFKPAELAALNTMRDQATESVRIAYERTVVSAGGGTGRKYRIYSRFRVKQGMAQAYSDAMKNEWAPAIGKLDGTRMRLRHVVRGGSPNDFISTFDVDSLAGLDGEGPAVRAMGADKAAAWNKKIADMGVTVEALLYIRIAELSWGATAAAPATR